MRLSAAKGRLDRSLNTTEQELQEAQQHILILQVRSEAVWSQLLDTSGGGWKVRRSWLLHTFSPDEHLSLEQ